MKTSIEHLSESTLKTKSLDEVDRLLHAISDEKPLSVGDAIEWLRTTFGLPATPQKLRLAASWIKPLQERKGKRKHYNREQLYYLVWVIGVREIGLSTRQLREFMTSLLTYTELSPKERLTGNEQTKLELSVLKLRTLLPEILRLSQSRLRMAKVMEDICNKLLSIVGSA